MWDFSKCTQNGRCIFTLSPGNPGNPMIPACPFCPGKPGGPGRPGNPASPGSPLSVVGDPRGPGRPGCPRGPGNPLSPKCIQKTKMCGYIIIKTFSPVKKLILQCSLQRRGGDFIISAIKKHSFEEQLLIQIQSGCVENLCRI